MDSSHNQPTRPTERRELQGARPTPLKVRKDSHKIKKPPVAPPAPQQATQPVQHRPPVIIYAVSPKVIHVNPSEFRSLVQRLTGSSSSTAAASSSSAPAPVISSVSASASASVPNFSYSSYASHHPFMSSGSGGISPAAWLATIEQGNKETRSEMVIKSRDEDVMLNQLGIDSGPRLDRFGMTSPGILSPVPSSLPAISPNIFSPLNSNGMGGLGFLNELSPAFVSNRAVVENNFFATTPSNFLSITTPVAPSPVAYWDLFHQYQYL